MASPASAPPAVRRWPRCIQGPEFAERKLTIVAFDDLKEVLDAIEAGIIYATMVQRPVQMGKLSISESNEILTEGLCAGVRPARHRRHRCYQGQPRPRYTK